MLGVELCPAERYADVLTPDTCAVTSFGNSLCRCGHDVHLFFFIFYFFGGNKMAEFIGVYCTHLPKYKARCTQAGIAALFKKQKYSEYSSRGKWVNYIYRS